MLGRNRTNADLVVKRAEALQNLSREHNHALLLARSALRAATSREKYAMLEAWRALRRAWDTEMAAHFETEERLMIPVLREAGSTQLAERLLREHHAIRRTVTEPARWNPERLAALAEVLRAHVRREEREAFPLIEHHAGDGIMTALAQHPAACGDDENCRGRSRPRTGKSRHHARQKNRP